MHSIISPSINLGQRCSTHCRPVPRTIPKVSQMKPLKGNGKRTAVDVRLRATDDKTSDMNALSNHISTLTLDEEERVPLERLAIALGVSIASVKSMAFRKKGLLEMPVEEILGKVETIAEVVEVSEADARRMVVLQPQLLTDTDHQAEQLKYGIRVICFELDAPKEEVVQLILDNPSILTGRKLRLSVADLAHLAMLREPKRRVVD